MADKPQQPTIMVKKADGTSVRMTMDEFKAYRTAMNPASEKDIRTTNDTNIRTRNTVNSVPSKTPSSKDYNPVQWSDDDHTSPLDASLHTDTEKRMMLPSKGVDERVIDIMSSLPFQLPGHLRGRLQSLLQSRLKDIRSDIQVGEYLLRPEASGGLGMNEEQMNDVMTAIARVAPKKQIIPKKSVTAIPPKVVPPPAPVSVPPRTPAKPPVPSVSTRPVMAVTKPVMHDVVAKEVTVEKESVGPLDELKSMTLDDFRRLGTTTSERTMKLLQKFTTLEQESYLFYLDAVEAWKGSPLYKMYQDAVVQALQEHAPIEMGGARSGMSGEEIKAVVQVNQTLV